MHIEQILDLQMDSHRWYTSFEGRKALTYTLMGIGGGDVGGALEDSMDAGKITQDDANRVIDRFIETATRLSTHLYRGDCVFVTKDILSVAMKASEDLPDSVTLDEMELLCPFGYMLFEQGIETVDIQESKLIISGFAWGLDRQIVWGRKSIERTFEQEEPVPGVH